VKEHPAVVVKGLTVGYDAAPIVKDVSVHVNQGNIAVILGPNGAGKSTLIKGIGGLLTPSTGSVTLEGADVTGKRPSQLASLGLAYVPQNNDVFPAMTVKENLEMGGYLVHRDEIAKRIDGRIEEFPKIEQLLHRTAGTLSGGERKLVAVARAMMSDVRVLLLDEPTAGLSPSMATGVLQSIVDAVALRNISILMVEQRARLAMDVCDWVYLLVEGRLAVSQDPEGLAARSDFLSLLAGVPQAMDPAGG